MAVGEAAQQLEEEEPHVPPGQPAGVLLQVLRQVRVLEECHLYQKSESLTESIIWLLKVMRLNFYNGNAMFKMLN